MALLLYEAGLVQVLLGNGVFPLLLLHLDLLLRLTLSEVPRPVVHLKETNKVLLQTRDSYFLCVRPEECPPSVSNMLDRFDVRTDAVTL